MQTVSVMHCDWQDPSKVVTALLDTTQVFLVIYIIGELTFS